jgi:formylmethanofuran dehydrogenase subunit B
MNKFKHVVCPGCTCLCDDLEISLEGDNVELDNACEIGRRWFERPLPKLLNLVDGQSADQQTAISSAVQLLSQSTAPLICGLDHLTTQAQQNAWKLADRLGATIDSTMTNAGRAGQFALQRIGNVTATLGEVASRSDLVVYWFCDPESTHPRHLARYGKPDDVKKRTVVVIDDQQSTTARQADLFIELPRGAAAAALATIRGLLRGVPMDEQAVLAATGQGIDYWRNFVARLTEASYGSVFYGYTTKDSRFDQVTDSLAALIFDLNNQTRFVSLGMRNDFNAQSAENVLAWSSGFAFAVNLHRGLPRFNGLEYSTEAVLNHGECDLILLASTESLAASLASLNAQAVKHFQRTPKIAITTSEPSGVENIRVRMTVSRPGKNTSGDYCRQDNVSLPLTRLFPNDNEVSAADLLGAMSNLISRD